MFVFLELQNKGYVIGNLPELAMAHNKFARLVYVVSDWHMYICFYK